MRTDSIIFDLDGTLWDTCHACATAWNRVLTRNSFEWETITADHVRRVTGRPHDDCIRETFSTMSPEDQQILVDQTAVEDNVEIEAAGGILYPGVIEGLERLAAAYPLYIVSNCQVGYIENFLRSKGVEHLFQDFESFGNTLRSKAHNLASVIERNGSRSPIMVGDTMGDFEAARANGVPFAFVDYGFGHVPEPDYSFSSFAALADFLLAPTID